MNVLINHCWCSDCNWGGNYDCRVIVTLYRVEQGKTYYDPPHKDWVNLTEKHPFTDKQNRPFDTIRLKPQIMEWLNKNIPDRKDKTHPKGWAVGTDEYNSCDGISFNIFFESARQALKFVKEWSVHKKPVTYLNYFKDIRKELDLKTNRLKRVKEFSR